MSLRTPLHRLPLALPNSTASSRIPAASGRRATVILRDLGTNRAYNAVCNTSGFYLAPNLPPGQYELTVQNSGFSKYVQTGITLSVGQTATVDVTLKVAAATELVTITGEAPAVEPTRSEISQVIDTVEIRQLSTNGRQFVDFALLTPGVATGRTSLQSAFTEPDVVRISFGGMRDSSNAVTVDGAEYINLGTGFNERPGQPKPSKVRGGISCQGLPGVFGIS
jgi:hypothetical protein